VKLRLAFIDAENGGNIIIIYSILHQWDQRSERHIKSEEYAAN
jgi:hypothetical protein